MTPLFKKLNLGKMTEIHVLDAPASFDAELAALSGVKVKHSVSAPCSFVIAFAITQAQLDSTCSAIVKACSGDAVVWIAYPKKTSRKYACEFDRDTGWSVLGASGFEPVRQVAIDKDWSALRFRRVEYIKSLTRSPDMLISK